MKKKKSFGFGKKNFGSETDTEIGPWFWFPIPKPNFGLPLSTSEVMLNCRIACIFACKVVMDEHMIDSKL